jgi:hypothetical protein
MRILHLPPYQAFLAHGAYCDFFPAGAGKGLKVFRNSKNRHMLMNNPFKQKNRKNLDQVNTKNDLDSCYHSEEMEMMLKEFKVSQQINKLLPYCTVEYMEALIVKEGNYYYPAILMERVQGESVESYCANPENTHLKKKFLTIMDNFYGFCQKKGIFLNDLHLGNVMITKKQLFLIDFGDVQMENV